METQSNQNFSPALCEFLEGQGFDIESIHSFTKMGETRIMIVTKAMPKESAKAYAEEMKKLSTEVCTNG